MRPHKARTVAEGGARAGPLRRCPGHIERPKAREPFSPRLLVQLFTRVGLGSHSTHSEDRQIRAQVACRATSEA